MPSRARGRIVDSTVYYAKAHVVFGAMKMSRALLTLVSATLAVMAFACAEAGAGEPSSPTPARTATATPAPEPARFASHVFTSVGATVDISGYGELLGHINYTDPPAVAIDGNAATVDRSGISCLRFRYRDEPFENGVQTQCIVGFDETGSCDGLTPLSFDLERNAPQDEVPEGSNANLFESGQGHFYAACMTAVGRYRLQAPDRELPTLYLHTVDAFGDGPYSLGSSEFSLYRNSVVESFSGKELMPGWVSVMAAEMLDLEFDGNRFIYEFDPCEGAPACSDDPDVLQPGDMLVITFGAPLEQFGEIVTNASSNGLADWFAARTGIEWTALGSIGPALEQRAAMRLLSLDAMDDAIAHFDNMYGVRSKGAPVVYWPFWPDNSLMNHCPPDGEPNRICQQVESAIQAIEAERIGRLKDAGYELWLTAGARYDPQGNVDPWGPDIRPHLSLFDGYMVRIAANQYLPKEQVPGLLADVITGMADEFGHDKPVHLMVGGPPLTGMTIAEFCEADICTSDFGPAFDQIEAALEAALNSFAPGQVTGLSVALFDGAHYDILDPYEQIDVVRLNRSGETGYNSPILNIYRAD